MPSSLTSSRNPDGGDFAEIPISDSIIGKRHRRDLGDIEVLAASILDIGLLHPVVVTPQRVLITADLHCLQRS